MLGEQMAYLEQQKYVRNLFLGHIIPAMTEEGHSESRDYCRAVEDRRQLRTCNTSCMCALNSLIWNTAELAYRLSKKNQTTLEALGHF